MRVNIGSETVLRERKMDDDDELIGIRMEWFGNKITEGGSGRFDWLNLSKRKTLIINPNEIRYTTIT